VTPTEHHAEAERLLELAVQQWEKDRNQLATLLTIPQAQVHATLALCRWPLPSHQAGDVLRAMARLEKWLDGTDAEPPTERTR
jgi:hypothetical protein